VSQERSECCGVRKTYGGSHHDQSLTVTQAARKHNVPHETLDDRVKKKVVHGTHPGPSTVLMSKDALGSYLVYMAQHGFPLTRTLTKALAWAIAVRSRKDGRFGRGSE